MPAYIAPLDIAGLKVVGGYDANKALGLPYIKANVVLTDPRTGVLKALVSGDYINDMRTGAQPAIMVKLLAASTDVVCFIGTGWARSPRIRVSRSDERLMKYLAWW